MPLDHSIVGKPSEEHKLTYTWKDTALYALGVGAKKDELDYLYEGRGPKVLPSFAVVPTFRPVIEHLARSGGSMAMVVHGAQKVVLERPFAPAGTLVTTATVRGIYDMRKFASVLVDTETRDDAGLVARTTWSILFRGEGGFGGSTPPKDEPIAIVPKDRAADFRIEEATTPEQALLYRLSGDFNPLHADPQFAASVGFPQGPILHGLCTYRHMIRHLAKGACGGDAERIVSFEGQFRRPVWPGDTLVTEGWNTGDGKIALSVSVKERNETVLSSGGATIRS